MPRTTEPLPEGDRRHLHPVPEEFVRGFGPPPDAA
jgi:hypothetical protein